MNRKREKELLQQQLELLSEKSRGAIDLELKDLSIAMCEVYNALFGRVTIPVSIICSLIVIMYFAINFIVLFNN